MAGDVSPVAMFENVNYNDAHVDKNDKIKASLMHVAPWIFSLAAIVVLQCSCCGLVMVWCWSSSGLLMVY